MTFLKSLPGSSSHVLRSSKKQLADVSRTSTPKRYVSSSPYGRTHVWKHRPPTLPLPFVPKFPQLVVRADGSTYTQYTTSPRSVIRLTRDTSNNPIWNPSFWVGEGKGEEEDAVTGRLGRFRRRFEGLFGLDTGSAEMTAASGGKEEGGAESVKPKEKSAGDEKKAGKK